MLWKLPGFCTNPSAPIRPRPVTLKFSSTSQLENVAIFLDQTYPVMINNYVKALETAYRVSIPTTIRHLPFLLRKEGVIRMDSSLAIASGKKRNLPLKRHTNN